MADPLQLNLKIAIFFSFVREKKNCVLLGKMPPLLGLTFLLGFWYHNPTKKVYPRSLGIFTSKTQFFFSLTKLKNMAILTLSWRGSAISKKYTLQLTCVKKDCFYPIQVLEMKFFNFWFISQRPKNG